MPKIKVTAVTYYDIPEDNYGKDSLEEALAVDKENLETYLIELYDIASSPDDITWTLEAQE